MEQIKGYLSYLFNSKNQGSASSSKSNKIVVSLSKQKVEPGVKVVGGDMNGPKTTFIQLSQSSVIRGGLVGAILTSLIGFNAGKYSRLGAVRKRLRFIRRFISAKHQLPLPLYTNYFYPNHKTVSMNFKCFSGEAGIGKSYHFQNMVYLESLVRPALYLSFKATGQGTTFEQDMAIKLDYGSGQNPAMLSQIMSAVRYINDININPIRFWLKTIGIHVFFIWIGHGIMVSSFLAHNLSIFLGMLITAYIYYFSMFYPFIIQSFRRSKPLIIFDDVNKIDNIGKLAQISRYLELLDKNMANIILISSDEETWFKLRKEPGLKDRLRQMIIIYDHIYTAEQILRYIEQDIQYHKYLSKTRINPLYTKQIVRLIIYQFVINRQVTIRRLTQILILNDEVEYQKFVKVLLDYRNNNIVAQEVAVNFIQILYHSQKEIICAKLKHIRRQINISEEEFDLQMKLLLEKGRLPSYNKIAPYLMSYNIVRDTQSEYVFNGKFMKTVFEKAYEEYLNNLKYYFTQSPGLKTVGFQSNNSDENNKKKNQGSQGS